jgi:hypothetical protein
MVTQPIFEMEGGMPDYATLRTKDLSEEALSADNVRGNARAKAVRASYEFWSTGEEALVEQAFAERALRPLCETRLIVSRMPCGPHAQSALGSERLDDP